MNPFTYARATDAADAIRLGGNAQAKYLGGGTNLVDLMRETIERPAVLVDGARILFCLALAVQYEGRAVTTVEGLASGGALHPLQRAFIEHDGFQCGYCTSGQICSAIGMIEEVRRGVPSHVTEDLLAERIALSRDELRERMSGNLCRCGAHNGIVAAIEAIYAEATK